MQALTRIIRQSLAFQPERSRRFFTLRVALRNDIPLSGMPLNMQRRSYKSMKNG